MRTTTSALPRLATLTSTAVLAIVGSTVGCGAPRTEPQGLLTRHTRDAVLNGTAPMVGTLPADQSKRLVLVLPLRDQAGLDAFLKDLYDPSSPSYRQFLTVEQFTERFGPTQADYDAVREFAESNGFSVAATSRNRMNLDVIGSVATIEQAFHVTMGVYQHPTEARTFYAPDREPKAELSVPLWHVSGLDDFSIPQPLLSRRPAGEPNSSSNATTGSGPSASFLGSDMRAAYYGGSLTGSGQSLGLFEFLGTDLADLNTYYANIGQTNNVPITLLSTDGTSTSCAKAHGNCDDTEQTLDMTQALGMAPGLSSLVVYVGSTDTAIFNAMATASPLNAQLSCSWGWSPADPSSDKPYFQEFAAQGQNLFVAAGDSGAWKSHSSDVWPADSDYIVSVGGTDLSTTGAGGAWSSETAWSSGGGGISPNKQTIPSWQTAAAAGCPSCSKTYRNGPDVSANANYTFYVCSDQTACTANEWGGTSFAAPMWAGYLALVNEQQVANGQSPLGFINPTLYSIGAGSSYGTDFHDITSGSTGDSATVGYDLASGWGSPNGANLLNALAVTVTPGFTLSASPSSVSITQGGASGTSTITVADLGGFSGSVTLAASGVPSGVTASFGTNPATSTSVLTLTASSTATTGTATVTITGTSGSLTATTTVSLTVNAAAAPNFTIGASPSSVTVNQGANGTSTITITSQNGFNSATTLSAAGLPSGVTASFSTNPVTPAANSSATSTLTLTASSSATVGTATVTVTGTSGSTTHSATISLTVNASGGTANFKLSLSPSSFTITDGGSTSTTLTVTSVGGFHSAVTLSVSAFPSGVTASASSNPVTPPANGSVNVTITWTASRRAPTGTTSIELIGTSGSLTNQTPVTITVAR